MKQGEIPVSLRAVSTDEEGHRLFGPPKDIKITCPGKGSYVILVPFSVSNQYNTNFNLMEVPEASTSVSYRNPRLDAMNNGVESLIHASVHKPGIGSLLSFRSVSRINGNYQHPLIHRNSEQTQLNDYSNQQFASGMGNGRSRSLFNNGVNSQNELHHSSTDFSHGQVQGNWKWVPFTRQNNIVSFPVNLLHQTNQKTRLPSERENNLHLKLANAGDSATSDVVSLDGSESQDNDLHRRDHVSINSYADQRTDRESSTNSNQNEFSMSKYRAVTDGNSCKISCPLLELMKTKGVHVSLNFSDENFELKIRGQGNLIQLLQNIDFPLQNHIEVETEFTSENTVHKMEGSNLPLTSESIMNSQEPHHQDFTDQNKQNYSANHKNNETYFNNQNSTHDTSLNHSVTNEEVVQRQVFINETSNFMTVQGSGNSSQTNDDRGTSVFVDSVQNQSPAFTSSPIYVSPNPQPVDSGNNNASMDKEDRSFYTENVTKKPNIPDLVEPKNSLNSSDDNSNLFSEPAGPDNIHISTVSTVQTNSMVINASEADDVKRHRSRRDIQRIPIIFSRISQRGQFPLLSIMQDRHKFTTDSKVQNVPNDLPQNYMGISKRREIGHSIESIKNHIQRIMQRDESKQVSEGISQEYKDIEMRPVR